MCPTGAISIDGTRTRCPRRPRMKSIVVVGTSLAGLRAVETLRREGFDGRLTLVGAEPHLPYDRPPLSKELLAGDWEHDQIVLRKVPVDDLDLELAARRRRDRARRRARDGRLADGTALAFDGLVIATGSTPRTLPGPAGPRRRVHAAHARRRHALRDRLDAGAKGLVIGAGSSAPRSRPPAASAGSTSRCSRRCRSRWCAGSAWSSARCSRDLHRDHGVDLRTGVTVEAIEGDGTGRARPPRRRRARRGRRPGGRGRRRARDPLARRLGAHARQRRGVRRDAARRAGHRRRGRRRALAEPVVRRRGHAARALDQRDRAGRARRRSGCSTSDGRAGSRSRRCRSCGPTSTTARSRPSGRSRPGPRWTSRTARSTTTAFVAIFGRGGRISGALGFNRPRQVMQYRRMIAEQASFEAALEFAAADRRLTRDHPSMPAAARAAARRRQFLTVTCGRRALLPRARRCCSRCCPHYVEDVLGGDSSRSASRSARSRSARSCCARSRAGSATATGAACSSSAARSSWRGRRALYPLASNLGVLVAVRMLGGFGEAGFFVGAATMITDLAPRRTAGRGGLVLVGRGLRRALVRPVPRRGGARRRRTTTRLARVGAARVRGRRSRAVHARESPTRRGRDARGRASASRSCNRARCAPGTVLFLGLCGSPGFTAFVPLYVNDIGLDDSGLVFLLYGVLILVVRIVGAKVPDRLGSRRAGTLALDRSARPASRSSRRGRRSPASSSARSCSRRGCRCMYPALLTLALTGIDDAQRASVVGTFSSFFDLSQGLGALHLRRRGRGHERPGRRSSPDRCSRSPGWRCSGSASTAGRARRCRCTPTTSCPSPSRERRVDRSCRRCSSPTTSRPSSAASSRTSTSCGAGCPPDETTVLTTPYAGAAEWDAAAGVPRRARPRAGAAPDAARSRAASTRSRARSAPT